MIMHSTHIRRSNRRGLRLPLPTARAPPGSRTLQSTWSSEVGHEPMLLSLCDGALFLTHPMPAIRFVACRHPRPLRLCQSEARSEGRQRAQLQGDSHRQDLHGGRRRRGHAYHPEGPPDSPLQPSSGLGRGVKSHSLPFCCMLCACACIALHLCACIASASHSAVVAAFTVARCVTLHYIAFLCIYE